MTKLKILAGMLAFAVVLTGCSLDESTGGSGGSATTPRDVEFDALYETLSTASEGIENPTVAFASYQGPFYLILFTAYIEAWDGSSSYTYGSITVTVTESDGIWTWDYTDSNSGDSMEYVIEETDSGWDFSWSMDGLTYVSGTTSRDGYTAQVDIFDVDTGFKIFSYNSEPYVGIYDLEIVSTSYTSGSADYQVLIRTDKDGLMGEWTYTDYEDTVNNDSGSWTEDL